MAEITLTLTHSSPGLSPVDSSSSPQQQRSSQQDAQMLEALGVLLNALMPNNGAGNAASQSNNNPLNRSADALGNGGSGQQDVGELLMKLLEKLISSNGAQNGQSAQNPLAQSGDAGNAASGASPLSGAGGAQNPENLSRSLLQDTTDSSLNNAINPTEDGGGQISDNKLLKLLLEIIANLMDAQNGEFGQPQDAGSGSSSGSSAPASGGGSAPTTSGSPTNAFAAPSSSSGAAPEGSKGVTSAAPGTAGGASDIGKTGAVEFPTASDDATVVDQTIKVGPGEVFDGGGKTFVASSKLGDGSQKEGQKPMFELAEGATLKNVVFGDNAADGIHVRGDAKIDNVHWTNVGEDALTVKSNSGKPANVEITNSSAQGASDKIFQLNADANLTVDNFKAKDFGTFVRTNGGQQGNWNLNLNNIDAENGKFAFVKSDSENLNVTGSNINLTNVKNHYKVPESANIQVN
ncbi:pectate lyase [Brenneria izadpanahii]|uniref:pectate lyase n=1 Tax=Brenneria izadpanahii TaxID=2722756 RepID=A0ABX7UVH1_9GAMM|nr:pectate lyase [Brenneria izadpanahii]QTF08195.1 pectate lyase [Brenneria izadpanahii]